MSKEKNIQQGIKKYLLKNPGFFALFPELMAELEVVTPEGELTNLSTHQLRTLQKENKQLKAQIAQLIKNAQQSESLMNRLFELLTELSVMNQSEFIPGFVKFVTTHFPSDYFKLLLAEGTQGVVASAEVATITTAQLTQFSVFQAKQEPMSGRLKKEKITSLFGEQDDIKSAIVLPIGQQAKFGLMSFASKDEEKFHPNSSSDILQKLAQILESYLKQQQPQDEHQAMS
ncbi:DUF484 family protein [Marinicella litoralis]|uniref:Uncharacterized protein YigA (DUF484 family) n=1 Tax=Marinicella litoralis TaxID=644220 RepID=A0A4R6XYU8_9GAMM|nr:DUF484 family protein [Marinicella litoralis]TDR23504.1 uncharacterized protein YigA (DUF484 family) [Marinicella litoralis]